MLVFGFYRVLLTKAGFVYTYIRSIFFYIIQKKYSPKHKENNIQLKKGGILIPSFPSMQW